MDRSCSSLHLEQDSKQKLCFGYTARVNVVSACKMMGGGGGGEGCCPAREGNIWMNKSGILVSESLPTFSKNVINEK